MVPEGWSNTTLGEHVRIHSGFAPASLKLGEDGNVPYVKVEDMNNCSRIQLTSRESALHEGRVLPINSVIFPKRGAAILNNKVRITGAEIILDTNMMGLEALKTLDPWFAYYRLVFEKLFKIADTSTIPQINNKHINPYRLPLPPLPEQRKIADILSTWDAVIEKTEALLANARAQKRALMQSLLTGKRRFPEFEGQPWKQVRLRDLAMFIRDGTHGTHQRFEEGIPMISAVNVMADQTIDLASAPKVSEADYNKIHKKYAIQKNDILLTVVGTLGRTALVPHTETFTAQRSVAILRMKDEVTAEFIQQYFQTQAFQNDLRRRANVTAQPGVYLGEIGKITVPTVTVGEMLVVNNVLSDCDEKIKRHRLNMEKLRTEKKALMQQLLTGKRRVVV